MKHFPTRAMLLAFFMSILAGLPGLPGFAQTTSFEVLRSNHWPIIDEALEALNCDRRDAGFLKDVVKDVELVFPPVRELLHDPFSIDALGEELVEHLAPSNGCPSVVSALHLLGETNRSSKIEESFSTNRPEIPPIELPLLRPSFLDLSAKDRETLATLKLVDLLEGVSYPKMKALLSDRKDAPDVFSDIETLSRNLDLKPAFDRELKLLQHIDIAADAAALHTWVQVLHQLAEDSLAYNFQSQGTNGPVRIETGFNCGPIIIGTRQDDVYDEPAWLILDPGGNDTYKGSAGAADARPGRPSGELPVAGIIDLGGNDHYLSTGLTGPGFAIGGFSVIIDLKGDDTYRSTYAGQAAALCGGAILDDRGGDDIYKGGWFSQGAALAGTAVLIDSAGNDLYQVGQAGQAYAGVRGLGVLLDRKGSDSYIATGINKVPWYPNQKFTMAQGFSIGARPFAGGGVALLIDEAGNDTYKADVYGQGVSYWYSLGMLVDRAGNDSYSMYHYGQGSGIHLSTGLLVDGAGDDVYNAGNGLAQGNAHDYAVGLLVDHGKGRDNYTADHFSQGRAMNNSFALLLDEGGTDSYYARRLKLAQGIGDDGRYREYGSMALMLDLQGVDNYSSDLEQGELRRRPNHGVIYDVPENWNPKPKTKEVKK